MGTLLQTPLPASLLLVHGTGVRKTNFETTTTFVAKQLERLVGDHASVQVVPCLWGDEHGSRLLAGGRSIPDPRKETSDSNDEATWTLLYADPLIELRILASHPPPRRATLGPSLGDLSIASLDAALTASPCEALLVRSGLHEFWPNLLSASPEIFIDAKLYLKKASRGPAEMSEPLARLLLAVLLKVARQQGHPGVQRAERDDLIFALVRSLGGPHEGLGSAVLTPILGLVKALGTAHIRQHRLDTSDRIAPLSGDILLYQTRGAAIRACIRDAISDISGPTIIVAHSLGGVACADLLIQQDLRYSPQLNKGVSALVTVGSQVSLLYELNSLVSLQFGQFLPAWFPQCWLNCWDPNDFLSYIASPIFGSRVRDIRCDSGEPFPEAHSAYWASDLLWANIKELLYGTPTAA